MSHYVLIHGGWEEAKSWDAVTPLLEAQGHSVNAIDLPGHGANLQPISEMNMNNYINTVVAQIQKEDAPVILVAHSMTGSVVSQVAERIPEKIERLIYVASFLLEDGGTVMEAMQSDDGLFLPDLVFSEDQSYAMVPEATLRSAGLHDVEQSVIEEVLPYFVEKQSTEPFLSPVKMSEEKFGTVPKTYIRTTLDRVTTPALQDRMIGNWNVEVVHDLEAGHFPNFSVPQELAELLLLSAPEAEKLAANQ